MRKRAKRNSPPERHKSDGHYLKLRRGERVLIDLDESFSLFVRADARGGFFDVSRVRTKGAGERVRYDPSSADVLVVRPVGKYLIERADVVRIHRRSAKPAARKTT